MGYEFNCLFGNRFAIGHYAMGSLFPRRILHVTVKPQADGKTITWDSKYRIYDLPQPTIAVW